MAAQYCGAGVAGLGPRDFEYSEEEDYDDVFDSDEDCHTTTANGCLALDGVVVEKTARGQALMTLAFNGSGGRGLRYACRNLPGKKPDEEKEGAARKPISTKAKKKWGTRKVALSSRIVTALTTIKKYVDNVFLEHSDKPDFVAANAADLACVTMDTVDIKNGKGERLLFAFTWLAFFTHLPATALALLRLVPVHASWAALKTLAFEVTRAVFLTEEDQRKILSSIGRTFAEQLLKDDAELAENPETTRVSLCAKWAPSRHSRFQKATCTLATYVQAGLGAPYVGTPCANAHYRKLLSRLRAKICTLERLMCGDRWDEIVPEHLPAVCLKKNSRVLMNLDSAGNVLSKDDRRIRLGKRTLEAAMNTAAGKSAGKKMLKGEDVQPHEMVGEIMEALTKHTHGNLMEVAVENIIVEAQWSALIARLKEAGTLPTSLALVDVSGSMAGLPMQVAITMGLIISEVSAAPWSGRFISFTSDPAWYLDAPGESAPVGEFNGSLTKRVHHIQKMPWGGSTDVASAVRLLLKFAVEKKVPQEGMPKFLFVLTDMHFDACSLGGKWTTFMEMAKGEFADAGYANMPTIVFWNIQGSHGATGVTHARADTPGVVMINGFSQQMLKDFLDSGAFAEAELALKKAAAESGDKEDKSKEVGKPSAWDVFQARLNQPRFYAVRGLCAEIGEGVLAGYEFVRPEPAENAVPTSM